MQCNMKETVSWSFYYNVPLGFRGSLVRGQCNEKCVVIQLITIGWVFFVGRQLVLVARSKAAAVTVLDYPGDQS